MEKQLTVRLPERLIERAKIRAIREKVTLQELVGQALLVYMSTPQPVVEDDRKAL